MRIALAFATALCATAFLASCSAGNSASTEYAQNSGASAGRIGAPGTPPPPKTMSVAQYGAFGYASEENYCHTARWVISGTLLPEYANDPHPVAIKRGTRARFIERIHTDCTTLGGNDIQDQDLIHVSVLDGKYAGQDRYILPSDWYTQSTYTKYARDQTSQKKRLAATYAAMQRKNYSCAKPDEDADTASAADWKGDYQTAYDVAKAGLAKNESCSDPAHKLMNSGFLMSWKAWAERHIGMRSQAITDMEEADRLLQQCTDSEADKHSDLNCDVARAENESMLKVWVAEN